MDTGAGGQARQREAEGRLPALAGKLFCIPAVLIIVLLACLANYKCLQGFFYSDDFLCLDYLFRTFHGEPALFFQRLVSPWQDPSFSLFYRPVCDLSFFFDYACWQNNAPGYHASNLAFHCASAVLLFFFVRQICAQLSGRQANLLAAFSAAIFACYPIHVEPIVWLTGRADLLASLFLLSTLLVSLRDLQLHARTGPGALSLYLAALLSKEASICAPLVLFIYLVLIPSERYSPLKALKQIMGLLGVTLIYLVWRFMVLGTVTGGYTGSLADALQYERIEQILNWDLLALLGLAGNLAVYKATSPAMLTLHLSYFAAAAILFLRIPGHSWDGKTARIIAFFAGATLAALIPAAPVLGMSGLLTNSRVFYLASLFYIPGLVTAVIPLEVSGSRFAGILRSVALGTATLVALTFLVISHNSYSPWLEGGKALRRMQASIQEELARLDKNKKLIVLNQYANFKGAQLIYRYDEARTLTGPVFFQNDSCRRLMALDEFPDFFGGSTTRLRRMLADTRHYEVEFFDFGEQKLKPVAATRNLESNYFKTPGRLQETKGADPSDHAYLVLLESPARIDDASQIELTISWKAGQFKEYCASALTGSEPAPDQSQLAAGIGARQTGRQTYHIPSFELRKIVGSSPATRLYVEMPRESELVSASLISGQFAALLQPDLSVLAELNNGNYKPVALESALQLDVSRVPGAAGMVLEQAQPDYLFKMTKICARDPQYYARLARSIRFNSTREVYHLPPGALSAGKRHAFRLIALDKDGRYAGFYSDTVSIDLRKSAGH